MDKTQLNQFAPILFLAVFFVFRFWRNHKARIKVVDLIKSGNPILLDVRNPNECEAFPVPDSLNIPLSQLNARLDSLDKAQNIIVYCASGGRSLAAKALMNKNGFTFVINAGGASNVIKALKKT